MKYQTHVIECVIFNNNIYCQNNIPFEFEKGKESLVLSIRVAEEYLTIVYPSTVSVCNMCCTVPYRTYINVSE